MGDHDGEQLLGDLEHKRAVGMRGPEVAIRTLNAPPNMPAPNSKHFYDTPDATMNRSSRTLFEHLESAEDTENFAYGEANRLGTQSAYANVPHVVSKHLTPLVLPSARGEGFGNEPFALPFPHVMRGDIAFYLRLEGGPNLWELEASSNPLKFGGKAPLSLVCRDWADAVRKLRRTMDSSERIWRHLKCNEGSQIFVNLQTLNYILHGIQHYRDMDPSWRDTFWKGFGLDRLDDKVCHNMEALATHVVRWCMAPFGVVTSEVKHQSDQAVAMVIDGRVERMRNYWSAMVDADGFADLVTLQNDRTGHSKKRRVIKASASTPDKVAMPQSGSELILILERVPLETVAHDDSIDEAQHKLQSRTYVLPNRWGSNDAKAVKMVFPQPSPVHMNGHVWQLVPSFASESNASCWSRHGFWRVGMVTNAVMG